MNNDRTKQTKIGRLPTEWKVVTLGETLDCLETGTRPKGGTVGINDGVPSISAEHMSRNGNFDFSNMKYVPHEFYNQMNRGHIRKYDILVVKDGATTGKTCFVDDNFPYKNAAINEHVFICRVKDSMVDSRFLFFWLWGEQAQADIRSAFQGVAIGGINQTFVKRVLVPLPPLAEQKRIAKTLSTIQGAVEIQDKIIGNLREFKKVVMEKVFTKGLNGEKTKQTVIGEIPEGWEIVKISDKYDFTKKPRNLDYRQYKQIPFVPMDRIPQGRMFLRDYNTKSPSEISSGTYFEEGDFLVSKITPCFENGKQCIASGLENGFGIATTEIIPVKEREGISDKFFLFCYLLKGDVRSNIASKMEGATGRQRIPSRLLQDFLIPFPPLAEQKRIAETLRTLDRRIEIHDNKRATLRDFFKTALNGLMKGGDRNV